MAQPEIGETLGGYRDGRGTSGFWLPPLGASDVGFPWLICSGGREEVVGKVSEYLCQVMP